MTRIAAVENPVRGKFDDINTPEAAPRFIQIEDALDALLERARAEDVRRSLPRRAWREESDQRQAKERAGCARGNALSEQTRT